MERVEALCAALLVRARVRVRVRVRVRARARARVRVRVVCAPSGAARSARACRAPS